MKKDDALLRQFGWLAGTPEYFQDIVLKKSDRMTVASGDAIFHQGDETGGAIGVIDGFAELHVEGRAGDETLALIVGPGYWVGGVAAVGGQPRRIGMVARTEVRLIRLPRSEMMKIAEREPDGWRHFCGLATFNLKTAIDLIDALRRSDPVDRLARVLWNLSTASPTSDREIPVTQGDLAALTVMSRSSVHRALASLAAQGLIERRYKHILVPKPAVLANFNSL